MDSHDALFLLKNRTSIPKLTYDLRCSACYYSNQLLQRYGYYDVLRSSLHSTLMLLGTSMTSGGVGVSIHCISRKFSHVDSSASLVIIS